MRAAVKSETSSDYGKMMAFALASPEGYCAAVLENAMDGMGCNEEALIERVFPRGRTGAAATPRIVRRPVAGAAGTTRIVPAVRSSTRPPTGSSRRGPARR